MLDYVCRPIGVTHYHGHVCSQGLVIELLGPKWVDSSWEQDDSSQTNSCLECWIIICPIKTLVCWVVLLFCGWGFLGLGTSFGDE